MVSCEELPQHLFENKMLKNAHFEVQDTYISYISLKDLLNAEVVLEKLPHWFPAVRLLTGVKFNSVLFHFNINSYPFHHAFVNMAGTI